MTIIDIIGEPGQKLGGFQIGEGSDAIWIANDYYIYCRIADDDREALEEGIKVFARLYAALSK